MRGLSRTLKSMAVAAAAFAAVLLPTTDPVSAQEDRDTLIVGTMWESLPLSMKARRSRFFNESEILDTLVKLDYGMQLVPGLALSWDRPSPEVWRFKLREGVTFHDGTPFDAQAAKHSLERVIDLLPYAENLLNIESMTALGPHELEIVTAEPFAALPNQLTDAITGIYAPSSFDESGAFVRPVGTGPWRFVEYIKQDRTIVERFDGYWGELPALERIIYRDIPDHNSRSLALETGEIDMATNPPPADVARLRDHSDFEVHPEPAAGLYYGFFNLDSESPSSDRGVRLAINHLIDRDLLIAGALDGVGRPAWQFFSPDEAFVPGGVDPYSFDPDRAAALLREAGYETSNGTWQKDGEPLELRIVSYSSRTEMPLIAEALSALLGQVGIQSRIDLFTWQGMLDAVRGGEYDLSLVFWTPEMTGHPDLHLKSQFHSQADLNLQGWVNPRFDALVDLGRTLDPGAERDATYHEALSLLQTDAPILPLVRKVFVVAAKGEVDGYRVHPSGFFFDFKNVSK